MPKILVISFNIVFYLKLFLLSGQNNYPSTGLLYWGGFISALLLVFFSKYDKRRLSLVNYLNLYIAIFGIVTFFFLYFLIFSSTYISLTAVLLSLLTQIANIIGKVLRERFPFMDLWISCLSIYFSVHASNLAIYFPLFYFIIQIIEKILEKYTPNIINLLEKTTKAFAFLLFLGTVYITFSYWL